MGWIKRCRGHMLPWLQKYSLLRILTESEPGSIRLGAALQGSLTLLAVWSFLTGDPVTEPEAFSPLSYGTMGREALTSAHSAVQVQDIFQLCTEALHAM